MKFVVKVVLVMYMTFLVTPTVVGMIKKDVDTSMIYSMSEEEQHTNTAKELQAELKYNDFIIFSNYKASSSSLIISQHTLKYDNAASTIFSPPPEQV